MSSNQTQSPGSSSVANLKSQGNKGNNMPFQLGSLLAQKQTTDAIISGFSGLITMLGTREYEAKLVQDSAGTPITWLEVRVYNTDTGIFDPPIYFLAGSTVPGAPTLPIRYLNDTTILSTIASNTTAVTGVVTSLTRVTGAGAGSVAAGKRTISFFNAGAADTNVNGAVLEAGELVTYPELSNRDLYAAIAYDALTSELLISTVG